MMTIPDQVRPCHPERSEGSRFLANQILRCAQDDRTLPILFVKNYDGSPMYCYVSITVEVNHMFRHFCYPYLSFPCNMRSMPLILRKIWKGRYVDSFRRAIL